LTPRFKPGDLAWVNKNFNCSFMPLKQGGAVGDTPSPEPGTACTIIRKAMVKDYPQHHRRMTYEPGQTYAGLAASTSWLCLLGGEVWIIDDCRLNKRLYTPRKCANPTS
jgi:hypothetical protein